MKAKSCWEVDKCLLTFPLEWSNWTAPNKIKFKWPCGGAFQISMMIGWKENSDSYNWSIIRAIVFRKSPENPMGCGGVGAFKRQTFYLPNLMQLNSNKGFYSFISDFSHEKFDWTREKAEFPLGINCCVCDFSIVSIKYFPLQSTWTDRSCEDKWKTSVGRHFTTMKKITFSQLSWKRKTIRGT